MVTKIYRKFKKLPEDAECHDCLEYHEDAAEKMRRFLTTSSDPKQRIDFNTSCRSQRRIEKNRSILLSILRCLEFAGCQGLALRGHRNDFSSTESEPQGNFLALTRFAVAFGDDVLRGHADSSPKNATYMSKTVQNELVYCLGEELKESIVDDVKHSHFYGIQADEVTDVSGWEQLGLSIRYVKEGAALEKHVSFVDCKSVTGVAICGKIMSELKQIGLDPNNCRAQVYNGAGTMSGYLNGCRAKFSEQVPAARYYHCASHQLNLALTKACSLKSVQCMLSELQSIGIYFKYSPKRQRCFENAQL